MAAEDEEIEESTGVYKAGVDVNPTIFLDVSKDFRQQQRSDPNFKLISYQIGTPTTPGHIGELKVAKQLEAQLQNRPDCLVIHSYSNLTPAELDYIAEIDLIILDKCQGLFILECKGVIPIPTRSIDRPIGSIPTQSDVKFPYCPRAAVLLAWKQIKIRLKQIGEVLQRDLKEIGVNYGLISDVQSTSPLLNRLLNRLKANSYSIHWAQVGCDYNNLNFLCGNSECYCSHTEAIGSGNITDQSHPHVVVGDENFNQLANVINERILADLPPIEVSDPVLLDNFYLFLLRRY